MIAGSVAQQRFQMLLIAAFSALMFALAIIGTYGVTAYGVSERTNEPGIRAALGATAKDIRRQLQCEGARLALIGIVAGILATAAVSRSLTRFVFRVVHWTQLRSSLRPRCWASQRFLRRSFRHIEHRE